MNHPYVPTIAGSGDAWIRQAANTINYLLSLTAATEDTAANIADVSAETNTRGKYIGRLVWDTTNSRMMRASGSAATDKWDVIDGSASVTPA